MASVRLSFVSSDPQHVYRRRRDISRDTDEFFLLSIQMRGVGRIHQHQREAVLAPGRFALYASTDPYELIFDAPFDQLVIQVPKQAILERVPIADMLTGIPIGGQTDSGSLIADCLVTIARQADRVGPEGQSHMAAAVVELLCSGLAEVTGQTLANLGRQDRLTMLRIESFIASNLKNPDLTRTDVAAGMNMSVRRINELLAKRETSITRRIHDARLEHIRRELSDPASRHAPIGTIAMKWGFKNLQHFSRSFRKKYGAPPRSYRALQ